MKKLLVCILMVTSLKASFAQKKDYKKLPSLGFHIAGIDFKTAQDLRNKSVESVLKDKQWYRFDRMNPALTLSYLQGLTNHIDFMGRLTGSFLEYPALNPVLLNPASTLYSEAEANVNIKPLTDRYILVPYLQAGIGASLDKRSFMAYIPLGAGLQFNLWDDAFFHMNTSYRIPVSPRANYSLYHSIGVSFSIKEKKVLLPPPAPEPVKDRDGDGVLDENDNCPDVAGLAAFKGCPDSDKDGIADQEDKCPQESGLAKYQGCPIPDSDKDGINDESDKCPTVPGVARYEGCPIPDGDGDGVNDEDDKCPAVSGTAANAGCPPIKEEVKQKVEMASKNVFFKISSSVLQKQSYAALDEVVSVLKSDMSLQLLVEGHSDNTGNADNNLILSEERANSVKAYIVSKGIEAGRIVTSGYGQERPLADNSTEKGRTQNRRVELKLKN
ncbi:MAG: OmpA family protein [Lacibacter sp.]